METALAAARSGGNCFASDKSFADPPRPGAAKSVAGPVMYAGGGRAGRARSGWRARRRITGTSWICAKAGWPNAEHEAVAASLSEAGC